MHRAGRRVADILELMAASQEALGLKGPSLKLEAPTRSLLPLRASLEEIRRSGVSINIEEVAPDDSGIAAPIFDRDGRAVAACTIGGPTTRIRARVRRLASEVKTAARTMSHLLGYREPSGARGGGAQDTGASRGARRASPRRRS